VITQSIFGYPIAVLFVTSIHHLFNLNRHEGFVMRKYLFILTICLHFVFISFSQIMDQFALRKIDSLKKILPSAKGTARVDMLNNISQGLLWIWESNDQYMHEAHKYSDEALKLAKGLKYKRGIGYALVNLFWRETQKVDTNRAENYKTGSQFQKAVSAAEQIIKIGDELNDDILKGAANNNLIWLYRWRGKREDYVNAVQKGIEYYEKGLKQNWKNIYTPFNFIGCDNCPVIEINLARLYGSQAEMQQLFKDETVQKFRKSIAYYEAAKANIYTGRQYLRVANVLALFNDIRTAIIDVKKALPYFIKENDANGEFDVYEKLCGLYYELGDLENGLFYSKKAVRLAESLAKEKGVFDEVNYPQENEFYKEKQLFHAYYWIGRFYSLAGDYENAFAYFKKASNHKWDNRWLPMWTTAMGNLHRQMGNYDSALFYFNPIGARVSLVRLYSDMKQYDKALEIFNESITGVTQRNNIANLGRFHAYAARAYYGKKDYIMALSYATKADAFFKTISSNLERIDNYQTLSDIYQQIGKFDSAYIFLKQYNNLRDSVLNKQFYIRLNDYKKEAEDAKRTSQINLLQKDNLIKEQELHQQLLLKEQSEAQLTILDKDNQLKDQKLKEEILLKEQNESKLTLSDKENKLKDERLRQQATIRNALIGGLLLFILLGVFVFRNLLLKRKNEKLAVEKRQAELQQKVGELEMQALRAQMNPHFIFNCLNSINRFIFKNETKEASDYLTRFSRLIRMVLLHSQKKLVPLEDELDMLKLYLDMERLRFKNAFDYHITTTNAIENSSVFIPPLLLQPFCENAIWHGLMHKDGQGHLNIELSEEEGILYCNITDDGVGREKAEGYKSKSAEKEKSMGLKITKERLSLLNQGTTGGTFYQIEDVRNEQGDIAGTKVELKIKYKETIEETV
jgi:tetratricopeptide (TPR) repeat protein